MKDKSIILLSEISLERNRELMRNTKGIIYKITNLVNGKVYIGQTTLSFYRRYRDGFKKCHNDYLQRSIDKYGLENFSVKIIAKNQSIDKMDMLEITMINKYNSCNPKYGYNLKTGGGNGKHTEESLKKISEATKGKNRGKDNKNSKKTILIYKDETIIRDSRQEVIDYMKGKYNLSIQCWFDKGITYEHQKDVTSCGYINEDGTIDECSRSKGIAESNKLSGKNYMKKTIINYKGNSMEFNSKKELIQYMKNTYNISCANWFGAVGKIPQVFQEDVISCGYVNENGTIDECNRNDKKRGNSMCKMVQMIYGETKIVKNSLSDMCNYLKNQHGIEGVSSWNSYGIPVKYQDVIKSFGYINKDGSIQEFKRTNGSNKKIRAIYKGNLIEKNSKKEFECYMNSKYGISGVSQWFTKQGIPFQYQKDITSCGYINEDGSVIECIRKSNKRGCLKQKKVMIIYKGEKIIKDSMNEMVEYFYSKYEIKVREWFYVRIPKKYKDSVTYCGLYDDYK